MAISTLSGIVKKHDDLESIIQELISQSVARHDIAIQGSPWALHEATGSSYVRPKTLQKLTKKPMREPFMEDDFGWVLGLTFVLPALLCVILFVFFLGDIMSLYDNVLYGALGLIAGSMIGGGLGFIFYKFHQSQFKKQEKKGGFLLEVTVYDETQKEDCLKILKNHHVNHIRVDGNVINSK